MKVFNFKNLKSASIHLFFWTAVWFFFYYFFSYNSDEIIYVTWFSSILLPLTMLVTYFIVYFLIPKYLLQKKYKEFALYSFYTLVFSSYMIVLAIYGCIIFLLGFNLSEMPPMSKNFYFILVLVYLVVGAVSFVSVLNQNFRVDSKNKELQNKILATQVQLNEQKLNYLKMQIHPHFLFNTLNTIYGFAIKQSKQTPEIILKLSNLLDYILYQINKPLVSLKEEVLHIKEYIELEKIRFKDTLDIQFTSDEISESIQIAPMLLIPFVENAFKHGNLIDGILKIEINISTTNEQLEFFISNTFLSSNIQNENIGIGLKNIQKRLDLHYNKNYKLHLETKENIHTAKLFIKNLKEIQNV